MAVVNRCAVGIYPSEKLLAWARQHDLDVYAAGAREPCLYLIPDYETEEEAEEILKEVYKAIFVAELDYWHRDTGTWPAERTYPVFRKWFEVRFYPLIQDLVGEELTATEVGEEFIVGLGAALEVLTPNEHDTLMTSGSRFAMELGRDARSVWSRRPGGEKRLRPSWGNPMRVHPRIDMFHSVLLGLQSIPCHRDADAHPSLR